MKINTIHTEIESEVIDQKTFNDNFKREFVFNSTEKRISRFLAQNSILIIGSNSYLKYVTLEVGIDKDGNRELFVALQYIDNIPNKFVRITNCCVKGILLKTLAVC